MEESYVKQVRTGMFVESRNGPRHDSSAARCLNKYFVSKIRLTETVQKPVVNVLQMVNYYLVCAYLSSMEVLNIGKETDAYIMFLRRKFCR